MPFIGYLVIFNPSFVSFFQSIFPHEDLTAPLWLSSLHSLRLSFLYFGLLALGVGIGGYTAFVPEQVRRSSTAADHISAMEAVWSPILVRGVFEEIVLRFQSLHDEEDAHPIFGEASPSFGPEPSSYLHDLVSDIFAESGIPYFPDDGWSNDIQGTIVLGTPYYFSTAAGHVLTDRIMQVMTSGRLVDRPFARVMADGAVARRREVFYLDYISADFSLYRMRIIIALLFALGFGLLLIPTITTSALAAIATIQGFSAGTAQIN